MYIKGWEILPSNKIEKKKEETQEEDKYPSISTGEKAFSFANLSASYLPNQDLHAKGQFTSM